MGSTPLARPGRHSSVGWLRRALALTLALGIAAPSVANSAVWAESTTPGHFCGAPRTPADAEPKDIHLVLDDSGSMFYSNNGRISDDSWSKAKYSLEVFASLMGPNDTLRVYQLSDFDDRVDARLPSSELSGSSTAGDRASEIRDLVLRGEGTPFAAVEQAVSDLQSAPGPERWLVVVTDGEFDLDDGSKLAEAELNSRVRTFVEQTREAGAPINVAYLAIGSGVPQVREDRGLGVFAELAPDSDQLSLRMNDLADRVYGRRAVELDGSGLWAQGNDSVDMAQVIVFAQGPEVVIGNQAETSAGPLEATEVVDVRWSEQGGVTLRGETKPAIPDESLNGQVAFFERVPRGDVQFDIQGASPDVPIRLFYKPQVSLGYVLKDPVSGEIISGDQPVAGEYAVEFGFTDSNCEFVTSSLLGEHEVDSVVLSQGGEPFAEVASSGDVVTFPKGDVDIALEGTYLDGVPISNTAPLQRSFLPPAYPSEIAADAVSYQVSEMGEFPPPDRQVPMRFAVFEDGVSRPPSAEEWATLDPKTFTFTHDTNLEFEVTKGEVPGQLSLLVRAPEGDVYAASTGNFDVIVRGSYLPGNQENAAEATVPIEVVDDLSTWDRFMNWFKKVGWKWLLALLLLILILGYIFKRRFPKSVSKGPAVSGTPRTVGMTATNGAGRFKVKGFRRFLPFVADRATLSYVPPGTAGFRPMKLKAGPGKSMIITNWRDIARGGNVQVNGMKLDDSTRGPVKLSAASQVVASTPQMTYSLTPNTGRGRAGGRGNPRRTPRSGGGTPSRNPSRKRGSK